MEDLSVTFIQTDLHWETISDNLEMLSDKINDKIEVTTDLVVLPEMFSTGFTMNTSLAETMEGNSVTWMKKISSDKKIALTGSLIIKENNNFYNRLIWVDEGEVKATYDKRHLFSMANEDKHYTAGTERTIVNLKGWRICPLICYDLRFPVWSRNKNLTVDNLQLRNNDETAYDILIYIANWPEKRSTAWKTLLQARAIENQSYVVGVNRTGMDENNIFYSGDSGIVDPRGKVLSGTCYGPQCIQTIILPYNDLEEYREKFPVWKDADDFEIKL